MTSNHNILRSFEAYKSIVFSVDMDLSFWRSFLKRSVMEHMQKDLLSVDAYTAIFPVYNIEISTNTGRIKTHERVHSFKTQDLDRHSDDFFAWITNISVLKTYNALETFLIQAIHLKYFPNYNAPNNKKTIAQIETNIKGILKEHGVSNDTKNNRHIIQFLKMQSTDITSFLQLPVRVDLKTNWAEFFEIISIVRNIIAHQGTIVNLDTYNEIKAKGKDLFHQHFVLIDDEHGHKNLRPIEERFLAFLPYINDFALNCVKFIFEEDDFSFLNIT